MSLKKYLTLARYINNWSVYFKRLSEKGKTVRYVTKGRKLQFDVPPSYYHVFREIFMEDFYQFNRIRHRLPSNPLVIDVGANVGFFSFQLLSQIPTAKIYAYEPLPENIHVVRHNLALNNIEENQVHLEQAAVTGNHTGTMDLYYNSEGNNSVVASLFSDFAEDNNASQEIQAVTLADVINKNGIDTVHLLKLDCEGSEYPIIYDSPPSVFDVIQQMIIEVHNLDKDKRNVQHLRDFLTDRGYKIEVSAGENGCPFLWAFRKPGYQEKISSILA